MELEAIKLVIGITQLLMKKNVFFSSFNIGKLRTNFAQKIFLLFFSFRMKMEQAFLNANVDLLRRILFFYRATFLKKRKLI